MKMPDIMKKYGLLLLVLIVFVFFKLPHLHYAYYWDESWPYAPAIRAMYDHGISLMPSAVDGELSRGHPLFFHAIAASWMKVFGKSHVAMHSFALFISLLYLTAIYETGLRMFNQRVAMLALLLVATQELYFVQSSFVLFEILLSFLAFLSLVFYVRGRYLLTILCLSALFYTKESGLIMGFILGLHALICAFNKKLPLKTRLLQLVSIGVPCVLIGLFFVIQKHERGWYVLPYYSQIIQHDWAAFFYNFRMSCVKGVFFEYNKYLYFLLIIVLAVVAARKTKNLRFLAILLPALAIYNLIDNRRATDFLPSIPFFIVFIIVWAYFLALYAGKKVLADGDQRKYVFLSGSFIFCFVVFSTMNFFTYRYLIVAIVPLLFLAAVYIDHFVSNTYRWLYWPSLGIILCINFWNFKISTNFGDAEIGAFKGLDVQQGMVDYLEQHNEYDKAISTGSFLNLQHITNPATGFLCSNKVFSNVAWKNDADTKFAIFDNIEPDSRYATIAKDTVAFKRVFRIERGPVWGEIYERR